MQTKEQFTEELLQAAELHAQMEKVKYIKRHRDECKDEDMKSTLHEAFCKEMAKHAVMLNQIPIRDNEYCG